MRHSSFFQPGGMVYEAVKARDTKVMQWWEYDCPECDTSNALPNPPFPATHQCRECGKSWDVQKMRAEGYVNLQSERVPK